MRYLVCIVFGIAVTFAIWAKDDPIVREAGFDRYTNKNGTTWYIKGSAIVAIMDLSPEAQKTLKHKSVLYLTGHQVYLDRPAKEVYELLVLAR